MAGFWSTNTEPLRKNRWTISFGGGGNLDNYSYALKKADKPSYKTNEITHKFGNYSFYYPGRVEWNTINITFASVILNNNDEVKGATEVDSSKNSADYALMNIFNKLILPPTSEANALIGIAKDKFVAQIGNTATIKQFAADGKSAIETWTLKNPFFTNIKFGDLSYDSEEIVDIECTIRYDSADLR